MPTINPMEFTGKELERYKSDRDGLIQYFEGMGFNVQIPRTSYHAPLLLCLLETGGRRHHSAVQDCVHARMADFMSDYEYQFIDHRERWKVQLSGAASALREEGMIEFDGSLQERFWRLTDKGEQEALNI